MLIIPSQGTWDIMVQRTGKQSAQRVTFIQNNFFHDAFFLKAIGELLHNITLSYQNYHTYT